MSNINRQEFLFLYETIFANANGDPLNENRPRIDEETGLQYVTMYRIKRTVRDYLKLLQLLNHKAGNDILLRAEHYQKSDKNYLKTLEMIIQDSDVKLTPEDIMNNFIDIRLFGGVIAIKNNQMHLQGPVQVSYGKSLHKVQELDVQLSTVMPSGKDKQNGTLGMQYVVPYSLIAVDGTINQFNAEKSNLKKEDVDLFFKSLWEGTTDLKTTSKNQKSLFLLNVIFNKEHELSTIGNLKDYVKLYSELEDEEIRSTDDYVLDITKLVDKLNLIENKLEEVQILQESKLKFKYNGEIIEDISTVIPKANKKVL